MKPSDTSETKCKHKRVGLIIKGDDVCTQCVECDEYTGTLAEYLAKSRKENKE